ncbi:MAG: hypothetical protein IJV69_06860 [Kiritimatiellae bacterium]|nr:hypothetical protein [Kiritimatiellia bacterium]
MRRSLSQLLTIARFSALEHLGAPVILLLTLAASVGTLLLPLFQFQRFSEDGRLARDCGLATAFLFGIFLAIGCASKIYRTLTDGTAAIALTKPLTRGTWFCGQVCGAALVLLWFLVTMGAAVLTAEACSPQYHTTGAYADVHTILLALLFPVGALFIGAINNRFFNGRFTLTATLCLPILLWVTPLFPQHLHPGVLTLLPPIALFLIQTLLFAAALATRFSPGIFTCITLLSVFLTLGFCHGSAYLPLDLLAHGGAVPFQTLALLVPQTLACVALFGWAGIHSLRQKESV